MGLGVGVGGYGDAETAQPAGVVILEEHVEVEFAGIGQRFFQHEHGHVPPSLPAVDFPRGLQVGVDRLGRGEIAAVEGIDGPRRWAAFAAAVERKIGQQEIAREPS